MAFTLKKHTSNQLESARLNDVNDNWGDIEQAIDILQTNASLPKGTLPNNTDLNDVKSNGTYLIAGANTYLNLPPGVTSGILTVATPNNVNFTQRIVNPAQSVERFYSTVTSWSNWR